MHSFQIRDLLSKPSKHHLSYETLPSHFSLADNMLAGAFAGIAVRLRVCFLANLKLSYVQEHTVMYPVDLLKVRSSEKVNGDCTLKQPRHAFRS